VRKGRTEGRSEGTHAMLGTKLGDQWRDCTGGVSRIVYRDDERFIVKRCSQRNVFSVYTADGRRFVGPARSLDSALKLPIDA
jgi:hypothetical protein